MGFQASSNLALPSLLTVKRVCGSGAQGVVSAALEMAASMTDCVIASRMENMDRTPLCCRQFFREALRQDSDGAELADQLGEALCGQEGQDQDQDQE
jgi:acetyl-CoA C-acetyltransferase